MYELSRCKFKSNGEWKVNQCENNPNKYGVKHGEALDKTGRTKTSSKSILELMR